MTTAMTTAMTIATLPARVDGPPDLADETRTPAQWLADVLAAPVTPAPRWRPGSCDMYEDADGNCIWCHGEPGKAGCGECGEPYHGEDD